MKKKVTKKILLPVSRITESYLIRRASGKFLACLVPDMNPTASIIDIGYLTLRLDL